MTTNLDTARSQELYRRAGELIPGWTQLISRRADQFANGVSPVYAQRAKGSRFIDVDENEYIDWVNAVGAVILGHADDVVDGAVKEQIDRGSLYTLNSPLELELAEELCATLPSAEMVRYTKGGGEACAVAARIARGTTGRDKILICGYHGWHDWYQAANFGVDPESGEYPFAGIEPIGVPKALAGTVIPFTYGDLTMLEKLLDEHHGEVAAIMMEPARSALPPAGYLEGVQALARAHGVILIFDEVSCGWRQAIAGIQSIVGVTPDMTVVAKAMSNGYPMGAVVGSRAIMEPAARMFISSSYWSDNIGLVASLTTIRELKRRNSEARFAELGETLRNALNDALADAGLPGRCVGLHSNPTVSIETPAGVDPRKISTLFIQEMARR
ncbi:MAG TPA: aminotransferase class III-fold pyridoxal phosphate-dependent enzyme, partial [Caldilineaceae bacterium]|nr:aminotransferase class III-fold pyridoxal phosphate-dependent enzyme [Caldilineaceae bacterium]